MKPNPHLLAASALRLRDANNAVLRQSFRLASAYLSGYNALQAVLPHGGAEDVDDHPLERVVTAAGERVGLSDELIAIGLALIAWERERISGPAAAPLSLAKAIAWATRVRDAVLARA